MNIFKNLFPFPVYSYQTLIHEWGDDYLFPEEAKIAQSFSPNRSREFSLGRYCARIALSEAEIENFPLLISNDGMPLWPQMYAGSIAHTKDCTAAVVTHIGLAKSIGIDIEEIPDFPMEIRNDILRHDEISEFQIYHLYPEEVNLALFFSIKESVYKAYSPVYHQFLEFRDVRLKLDESAGSYIAYVHKQSFGINQEPLLIQGRFSVDPRRVYSSAWIRVEEEIHCDD